jgi:hypothetical protein
MRKIIVFLILASFLIIPAINSEQPSQSYGKLYLNPFYRTSMNSGTNYNYNLSVNPPDGISGVLNAIISFNIQINGQTQNFTLLVNNKYCNNADYYIATAYSATGNTQIYFDCSNVITKSGNYSIILRSAVNTGTVQGWLDLTYMNNPYGNIEMHGTEYYINEYGKSWVQLIDSGGNFVDNGTCYIDIYTPDNLQLIERASMNFLEDGVYYYDFLVPDVIGVYPTIGLCYYITLSQIETADSGYIYTGIDGTGSYTSTATKNNAYWNIDENLTGGIYRLRMGQNYTGITQPTPLTAISVDFQGRWDGGADYLTIHIWNWSSGKWIPLSNTIPDTGGIDLDVNNLVTTTNATLNGLLYSGEVRIMMNDTSSVDIISSRLRIDYLAVDFISYSSPSITEVKGSSEIHVKGNPETNPFIIVETECGIVEKETSSNCGNIVDIDSGTNYTEGEVEINITVTSLSSQDEIETYFDFWSPMSLDCTALYWIKYFNGTELVDITDTATVHSQIPDENCHIRVPIMIDSLEEQQFSILMDNYMSWEIEWIEKQRNLVYNLLSPSCFYYASINGYTYSLPIYNGTYINTSNSQLESCHRFLDNMYWIDLYYNQSLEIDNIADLSSIFVELRWYVSALKQHMIFVDTTVDVADYNSELEKFSLNYVGGTEYMTNETAAVSTQFLRAVGDNLIPVNNANCNVTVYYPNRTVMFSWGNATYITSSNGIYSYSFITPNTVGIYHADFRCDKPAPAAITVYSSGTFHVAPWANAIISMNATTGLIYPFLFSMNSSLYYLIIGVNDSISLKISEMNSSIHQRIDSVEAKIDSVNVSIYDHMTEINSSIFQKLFRIQDEIASVNQTILDTQTLVGNTNLSIMNKLYLMQTELSNIYSISLQINGTLSGINITINTTALENLIREVNLSIYSQSSEINQSIMNKLYLIQGDLSDIYSIAVQINDTVTITYSDLLSINQTMFSEFYTVHQELQNITDDLAEMTLLIGNVNQSLTNELYSIQSNVNGLYDQINLTNISIMNKLYKIQDEITSINDTVLSTNESIMTKLYAIQGEISAVNASLLTAILILSNATMNITIQQESLFNDLVALWGQDIVTPSYTGFAILPSVSASQEDSQYVCINNQTLAKTNYINLTTPDGEKIYTRTITTQCTYGCKNNTCIVPDYWIYIILICVIIGAYALFHHFFLKEGYG